VKMFHAVACLLCLHDRHRTRHQWHA
jgi:hypothetical protein